MMPPSLAGDRYKEFSVGYANCIIRYLLTNLDKVVNLHFVIELSGVI